VGIRSSRGEAHEEAAAGPSWRHVHRKVGARRRPADGAPSTIPTVTTTPPRALTAALTALLTAACPSPRVHPRAAEEVSKGYRYLSAGDLERADVAFSHALEFNEDIPEAQNGAGIVARRRGDLAEARRRFEHAVKVAPDFAEGRVNLGELELAGGRWGTAEEDFRAALRVDPDLVVARLDLARSLLHRGRREPEHRDALFAAARREYLHLLESAPALPEAHHDLGFMDYLSGAYERAAAEYGRAVELAPDYAEALHGRCIALARLGRRGQATQACRHCLEVHAGDGRCVQSLRAVAGGG
jgi:Flp pilus assembly protein TadD